MLFFFCMKFGWHWIQIVWLDIGKIHWELVDEWRSVVVLQLILMLEDGCFDCVECLLTMDVCASFGGLLEYGSRHNMWFAYFGYK